MATIFTLPKGFEAPELNWEDTEQYEKECSELIERLRKTFKERNKNKNVGEIIKFQVADGYAEYMVISTKPVELIHLPFWDSYQSETAQLMTAKAIKEKIELKNMWNKLAKQK